MPWLEAYDPDIIYSYVDLTERSIRHLHELIYPSFLVRHEFYGEDRDERAFRPKLPLPGLKALSVSAKASYGNTPGGPRQIKLIDKHPNWPQFAFVDVNFGSYWACSERWPLDEKLIDSVKTVTLTPENILTDTSLHPKPVGDTVTTEEELLELLSKNRQFMGFSMLSAWDTPRIEIDDRRFGDAFSIVVGDTFSDHLMFWNLRSYYRVWLDRGLVTLLVSKEDLDRPQIWCSLVNILMNRNNVISEQNSQAAADIFSMSLEIDELNRIYHRLVEEKIWIRSKPKRFKTIDAIVPSGDKSAFSRNLVRETMFQPDDWQEIVLTESAFRPPTVFPRHLQGFSPLVGEIQQGMWAQDLEIERENNLSWYVNGRHVWRLPRRLRVTDAFTRGYQTWRHGAVCLPRVNSDHMLTLFADFDGSLPEVGNPEDSKLFEFAICGAPAPWPFKRQEEKKKPINIAVNMITSDKGQYLRTLLRLSGTLNEAESIFLNKFWLEYFERIGATQSTTEERLEEVKATLQKKFKGGKISNDREWINLSKVVLQEARSVRLLPRYLRFDRIEKDFDKFRKTYWRDDEQEMLTEDLDGEERKSLAESVQYLASKKILHQGLEWRCRGCGNRNWLSIGELDATMVCRVCHSRQQAPASFSWQFRLDGFVLEGLREHGLLSCLWTLANLSSRAQSSFYFCESAQLFYDDKAYSNKSPNAEFDLIAVVDGLVYLCEVKSSSRELELAKFENIAARIRPDIALLAVMGELTQKLDQKFTVTSKRLNKIGIETELLTLRKEDLEENFHLPIGRTYRYRLL